METETLTWTIGGETVAVELKLKFSSSDWYKFQNSACYQSLLDFEAQSGKESNLTGQNKAKGSLEKEDCESLPD